MATSGASRRLSRRDRSDAGGRRGAPTPAEEALDTRGRIVSAALAEFASLGFEGASTRQIAARAGVNQGLIAYYFSGKEELWRAAVEGIFSDLLENLRHRMAALDEVDAPTRLRLMIRHFVRFAAAHPELHRLMIQEGTNDGPRMEWLVDSFVKPLFEGLRALIKAAQADGVMRHLTPFQAYCLLVGAGPHPFVTAPECKRLTGEDPMRKDAIEAHAALIEAVLLGPGGRGGEGKRRRERG